jgi:YD repeat-containing protein
MWAVPVLVCWLSSRAAGVEGSISVFGPEALQSSVRQISYEVSGEPASETTIDFDDKGRPARAVWEQADGSRNALDLLFYDKEGRLSERQRDFSSGASLTEKYTYTENGALTGILQEWSDGVTGSIVHEYHPDGKLNRTTCLNRDRWLSGKILYKYEGGRKTAAEILKDTIRAGAISYRYDSEGRLTAEKWSMDDGWSQSVSYEYHANTAMPPDVYTSSNVFIVGDGGYCVCGEKYDYSGQQGGPSYYEYDGNGKLTGKKFVRSDGLTTQTAFIYDANGHLTRSYRAYADGRRGVFAYEFNDQGLLIERTLNVTDGKSGREEYQYDDNSRLLEARWINFDKWLTGTLSFTHDSSGLPATAQFKGEDGIDADITFTYDDLKRLVKIHWELSFGGTQTYEFQYEPCSRLVAD